MVCFVNDKVVLILIKFSLYDKRPTLLIQKQAIRTVRTERNIPSTEILLKFVLCYFKYLVAICLQHLSIWCNCGLPLKEELLLASFPFTSLFLSFLSTRPGNCATTKTVLLTDLTDDLVSLLTTSKKRKTIFIRPVYWTCPRNRGNT